MAGRRCLGVVLWLVLLGLALRLVCSLVRRGVRLPERVLVRPN